MRLTGNFNVMSLADLLQWIMNSRKTGRVSVSHGNASREIYCRDGSVVACSSDDPLVLMGQFLLFHGRISEAHLQQALKTQEATGENLGDILVAMGAIRLDQLLQVVASKAMETIHGLFDWEDATFEFVPDVGPSSGTIEVDLAMHEILLEGARRQDEMVEMRKVFPSRGVVLARTDRRPDEAAIASPMAKRIYQAIDGRRTLAEILLACRASEYLTCSFLIGLLQEGIISVEPEAELREGPAETATSDAAGDESPERVRDLLRQGDYCGAFDLVQWLARRHPGHESIKSLSSEVEPAFIASMYRGDLPPEVVPVPRDRGATPVAELSAEELHLLSIIDGKKDVKSIVWTAPLKLAPILRTLKSLQDRGLIELTTPQEHVAGPH